ncbi:MAG: DUF3572 domain-containing protein [Pseudomonadota bacterium]|jgi:hypothetical protein|nr:DUF3572 domain-containing protein [Pseudomonadota bacterium]
MRADQAETVALKALGWLVGNEELLPIFLGASGATPDDLKARAATPEFQISVLDFLTMDDAWVMAFCEAEGLAYDIPMRARQALPGGADMHWT